MNTLNYYKETWVPIIGYEGQYEIGSFGSVKRVASIVSRIGSKGNLKLKEKVLKPSKDSGGYLFIRLSTNGLARNYLLHRLVGLHFVDNPCHLPEINHKFGNKEDNRWFMLEWSTRKSNMTHASESGLLRVGERSHMAKLKEGEVNEILQSKLSQRELATIYGVSRPTIQCIKNGRSWKRQYKSIL